MNRFAAILLLSLTCLTARAADPLFARWRYGMPADYAILEQSTIYQTRFTASPSGWVVPGDYSTTSTGMLTQVSGYFTNCAYWSPDNALQPSSTRVLVRFQETNSQFVLLRRSPSGTASGTLGMVDWTNGVVAIYHGWNGSTRTLPTTVASNSIPFTLDTNHIYQCDLFDLGSYSRTNLCFSLFDLNNQSNVVVTLDDANGWPNMSGQPGFSCLTNGPVLVQQLSFSVPTSTPDILLFGDSHTSGTFEYGGWGATLAGRLGANHILIGARGGDSMLQFTNRLAVELGLIHPRYTISLVGANDSDIVGAINQASFIANYALMTNAISASGSVHIPMTLVPGKSVDWNYTNILWCSSYIRSLNNPYMVELTPALTSDNTLTNQMLPAYSDGSAVHLNAAGQAAIYNAVWNQCPFIGKLGQKSVTQIYTVNTLTNTLREPSPIWCRDVYTPSSIGGFVYWDPTWGWVTLEGMIPVASSSSFHQYALNCLGLRWHGRTLYQFSTESIHGSQYNSVASVDRMFVVSGTTGLSISWGQYAFGVADAVKFNQAADSGIQALGGAITPPMGTRSAVALDVYFSMSNLSDGTDQFWVGPGWWNSGSTTNYPTRMVSIIHDPNKSLATTYSGDTSHYICATMMGSSGTYADSGVVPTTSTATPDRLTILWEPASIYYKINGTMVATNTLNKPTDTIQLAIKGYRTAGTNARWVYWWNPYYLEFRSTTRVTYP